MKIITISVAMMVVFSGLGQKKSKTLNDTNNTTQNHFEEVYKNAVRFQDSQMAINAAHNLIVIQGANSSYKDSLAYLYFGSNNPLSCYLICNELLVSKPNDLRLLEMNAVSLKNLGLTKESIDAYERLLVLSKNRLHAYELATLQFALKRNNEALATIQNALKSTEPYDAKVIFETDKGNQFVPLEAAINNLLGLLSFELKETDQSLAFFNKAIELFPEFYIAAYNKASIEDLKK